MALTWNYGPVSRDRRTMTTNGRTYTSVVATPQLVPDFDSVALEANGWLRLPGFAGTSAQRPTKPTFGMMFLDTTLSKILIWMGSPDNWIDAVTGAANQ